MPELKVMIGGREFEVACQEGEEHFLRSAAGMLDAEAQSLVGMIGRMPETRLLLMSGLLLADKTAGLEDQLREAEAALSEARATIEAMRAKPERVEVPVIPQQVIETLAELTARAESLADQMAETE